MVEKLANKLAKSLAKENAIPRRPKQDFPLWVERTQASFSVVVRLVGVERKFLHETARNKLCGLSWVTGSWYVKKRHRCWAFALSTTSWVLSSSIRWERRQTSLPSVFPKPENSHQNYQDVRKAQRGRKYFWFWGEVSLLRGHSCPVRIRNGADHTAWAGSWVESGTVGSTADQMDMKGKLCRSPLISKKERHCSFPPRNDESQGGIL